MLDNLILCPEVSSSFLWASFPPVLRHHYKKIRFGLRGKLESDLEKKSVIMNFKNDRFKL